MGRRTTKLPLLRLDVDTILYKADGNEAVLTYGSTLSGVGYATNGQSILMLQDDGFIGRPVDDWRVLHEELGYIIEEADRWARQRRAEK